MTFYLLCDKRLPIQYWYDWEGGRGRPGPGAVQYKAALDQIPVYQRGGTIVPIRQRPRRSSALMQADPYTLRVALDYEKKAANGRARDNCILKNKVAILYSSTSTTAPRTSIATAISSIVNSIGHRLDNIPQLLRTATPTCAVL